MINKFNHFELYRYKKTNKYMKTRPHNYVNTVDICFFFANALNIEFWLSPDNQNSTFTQYCKNNTFRL